MILVDTSVWIDHLRRGNSKLRSLLLREQVCCHPFVAGELACGNLKNRSEILGLLHSLPEAEPVDHSEALHLVESRQLYGKGLGWIDAHILASALVAGCAVWTLDEALGRASAALNLNAQ